MENDRIAKRVYVGECASSRSVGRLRKRRWINTIKDCLRREDWMSGKQREWYMVGVCEGECIGHNLGDEPLTLMRCYSYKMPQTYEALEGRKSV